MFYVSAVETERCHKGMTVAYAAHCQQEAALDRYEVLQCLQSQLKIYMIFVSPTEATNMKHAFMMSLSTVVSLFSSSVIWTTA